MTPSEPPKEALTTGNCFTRDRRTYTFLAVLTMLLGLASRRFDVRLPVPLHKNTGDVLWAVLVLWLAALLFPARSGRFLLGLSALYALCIECAKLLPFPWLAAMRATTFGHLLFGSVFSWANLIDYGIGLLLAAALDKGFVRSEEGSRAR